MGRSVTQLCSDTKRGVSYIDGLSEQEILNKIHHMTMVANNYLDESRPHKEVIDIYIYIYIYIYIF